MDLSEEVLNLFDEPKKEISSETKATDNHGDELF